MIKTDEWTKSSYSSQDGSCVEFKARSSERTAVRDSKVPDGPRLELSNGPYAAFIAAAKAGTF